VGIYTQKVVKQQQKGEGPAMPPYDLRERSKHLITARKWGVGLVTACLGLGLFASEVTRIRDHLGDPRSWAYLALFLMCGALVLIWIWCTQKELDLLFEWMDPQRYEPPSDLKETMTIVALGALLVILVFASRNPVLFGAVFTTYSVVIMIAIIHFNQELRAVISESRRRFGGADGVHTDTVKRAVALQLQGIGILEEYFLFRPHTQRHIAILVVSCIGLLTGILSLSFRMPSLHLASYAIFVTVLLVSEWIIAHWRNARDQKLRPVTAELNEIKRSQEENQGE
jgi:hypothetical protein